MKWLMRKALDFGAKALAVVAWLAIELIVGVLYDWSDALFENYAYYWLLTLKLVESLK